MYTPFNFIGAANPVVSKAFNKAGKVANKALDKTAPVLGGELGNALGIQMEGKSGQYQKLDKALMDYNSAPDNFYTKEQMELMKESRNIARKCNFLKNMLPIVLT